jgi:hypothetical protein
MDDHDLNRHNIGVPMRHAKRHSTEPKKNVLNHHEQESKDSQKLPSLFGEHKKIQQIAPESKKIDFSMDAENPIPKIIEEDNDWMGDSMIESGYEMKSSTLSKKR